MKQFYKENKKKIVGLLFLTLTLSVTTIFNYFHHLKEKIPQNTIHQGNQSIGTVNGNINYNTYKIDTTKKEPKIEKKPALKNSNETETPVNITQQNSGGENVQNVTLKK